jgi:galactonate dehydratase
MHYGSPPIMTTLQEDVADGFVVCAGAYNVMKQSAVTNEANKPFWLQLVGTGITTTWAAHLGAVCPQAKWPAITCMNIWKTQLLAEPIKLRGGYYRVPETPGLGLEIEPKAIEKYQVDYSWVDPPRHVYRYARASGEVTYYGSSKQSLHNDYPRDAMPVCEPGSECVPVEDDGSRAFAQIWDAVQDGHTLRRVEKKKRARGKK